MFGGIGNNLFGGGGIGNNVFGGNSNPLTRLFGPMGYLMQTTKKTGPDRSADEYNSEASLALSRDMTPSRDNSAVRRWQDAAFKSASGAGANPAAAAAAGARAGTKGYQTLSRLAPDYWQRLMNQALQVKQGKDSIRVTDDTTAFLQGFLGGGGAQAAGGMGGGWTSQPAGGATYGNDWWTGGDNSNFYGDDGVA